MGRRGSSDRGQRDDISPSLDALLAPIEPVRPLRVTQLFYQPMEGLNEIEDGRRFAPYDVSPRDVSGTGASVRSAAVSRVRPEIPPAGIAFSHPEHVVRCVRRKTRREVIFALKKRGKGAGARRRRRNYWSNVRCR